MAIAKAMASADTALSAAWHYSEGLSMGESKVWCTYLRNAFLGWLNTWKMFERSLRLKM